MDNAISLELEPLALRCETCGGPVLFALPFLFRLRSTATDGRYRIRLGRQDGNLARIIGGDHCDRCQEDLDVWERDLAELKRVHSDLGLGSFTATFQRFDWDLTGQRRDLGGCTVTSFGLWCASPEPLPELSMRSLTFDLPDGEAFSIVFPLEVVSHPSSSAQLHSWWDPGSGDVEDISVNARGADVNQLKRLLDGLSLIRASRSPGRPAGSGYDHLSKGKLEAEFDRLLRDGRAKPPSKEAFAMTLGVHPGTVDNCLKRWQMPAWSEFKRQRSVRS
jgi:hypothetical protein